MMINHLAGYEAQDLYGEKTELQKRTLNRGLKPKPRSKSKKPSGLKEQRVLSKQQTDDDFERMRSQYISEDNIRKNKWAKLRQRIGIIRKADDDKPFSRKELDKERKSYEEAIKRKRRNPTKSELKNKGIRCNRKRVCK